MYNNSFKSNHKPFADSPDFRLDVDVAFVLHFCLCQKQFGQRGPPVDLLISIILCKIMTRRKTAGPRCKYIYKDKYIHLLPETFCNPFQNHWKELSSLFLTRWPISSPCLPQQLPHQWLKKRNIGIWRFRNPYLECSTFRKSRV